MNKKALAGEAVAWTASFLIIAFLLLIFNSITISLAANKKISFSSGDKISFSSNTGEDFLTIKQLEAVLNTPVDSSTNQRVLDSLVNMSKPFLSQAFLDRFKLKSIDGIKTLSESDIANWLASQNINFADKQNQDSEIIKKIDLALANSCKDYFLKFPLGYLYKARGKDLRKIQDTSIFNPEYLVFFNNASLQIYSGINFNVVYMERDYCV